MARHDTTVCGAPCNARKECEAFSYGCNVMVANEGHGWSLSERHVVGVGKSRRGDGEGAQYEGVEDARCVWEVAMARRDTTV